MAAKAMVFIDGAWLYHCRSILFQKSGSDSGFEIDYARLPRILCDDVANAMDEDVSIVRTLYFGTIPGVRSGFNASKQVSFYDFLEKNCGYETEIHEIDPSGDSHADDLWIKMSLASSLLFYAGQHDAFDIAVILTDDPAYTPAIRRARLFGKRIQVVGIHTPEGGMPPRGASLFYKNRVNDYNPVFLDDHLDELRLVRTTKLRTCKLCGREEQTTWAGSEFYCSSCRGRHRQ